MQDHRKRIIVDGVDFGELFQFHRIALAISSSLQPPRLVIGLLVVLAIITFGKGWDRLDRSMGPSISPDGLLAGQITEAERRAARRAMVDAVMSYVPQAHWPQPVEEPDQWTIEQLQPLLPDLRSHFRDRLEQNESEEERQRLVNAYNRVRDEIVRTRPLSPWEATSAQITTSFHGVILGVINLNVSGVFAELSTIFYRTPLSLWKVNKAFLIVFGLFLVLVLGIGGGALSRMAAAQTAGLERLRVRSALAFSVNNWRRFSVALALPLLLALVVACVLVVLGLLMAVPWIDMVGGLLYGIGILLGFVIAFLLLGYAAGFSLLVPAVACENCDPGDAMQRSFAYVINRPLHLLFYAALAILGLVIGYLVVAFIAAMMLNLTAALVGALHDHPAVSQTGGYTAFDLTREANPIVFESWHGTLTGWFVYVWETIVVCLVGSYVIAYYYSASTIIYLLMRRAADGQDIEEIWRPGLVPGTLAPISSPAERRSQHG